MLSYLSSKTSRTCPRIHRALHHVSARVEKTKLYLRGRQNAVSSFKSHAVSLKNHLRTCESLQESLKTEEGIQNFGDEGNIYRNLENSTRMMMGQFEEMQHMCENNILLSDKERKAMERYAGRIYACYGTLEPVELLAEQCKMFEGTDANVPKFGEHQRHPVQPYPFQCRVVKRRPVQSGATQSRATQSRAVRAHPSPLQQPNPPHRAPKQVQYPRWGAEWRDSR